jgi:hypothetical protein
MQMNDESFVTPYRLKVTCDVRAIVDVRPSTSLVRRYVEWSPGTPSYELRIGIGAREDRRHVIVETIRNFYDGPIHAER